MMRYYPRYLLIGLLSLTLLSPLSMAGQKAKTYDRIQLSAEASMPVENDTLTAQLYAQREGSDLSQLADEVNRKISQAVQRIKQVEGVSLQTQGYQTYPVYQQQRVTGWRVRQSIRLESRDSAALSRLLGELQSSLALESLQYSVSPAQRQAAEEQLIAQAIAAFQQRAALVTKSLGRSEYRLVEMQINNTGESSPPMRLRAGVMAMEAAVAPPSLEAGSQILQVNVNGTIELQLNQ
ncbi:MAG: SIMPL domain-containing protein [Chromatiales bacterium]